MLRKTVVVVHLLSVNIWLGAVFALALALALAVLGVGVESVVDGLRLTRSLLTVGDASKS
jgi:hypothetical protein